MQEQRRRNPGIAEVTFLAYDRHEGMEDDRTPGSCGLSAKSMTAIAATCAAIGFIAYMLTSSSANPATTQKPPSNDDAVQERLPRALLPSEYRLKIIPHLEEGNFTSSGELWITFNCEEPTNKIILNAKEIKFDEVELHSLTKEIVVTDVIVKDDSDVVVIKLNKPFKKGDVYKLYIRFTGILNDVLQGFYRSSYVDLATKETRWMASTQFSPTYARRAFPCFDEPSFKARFKISLGRRTNMTSISNMPRKSTESISTMPGFVWDHYPQSLLMSTYLVAFIVTDFGNVEVINSTKPVFKLWSRRDVLDHTEYISNVGPKILHYFEGYFNITFPLEKQDIVALPDFGYTAMENWGLITFRESGVLIDEKEAAASVRQDVALVAAHELAHQWFGNLVTPAWWSDLWLKEGFASFFANLAVDHVEPTWRVKDALLEDLQKVLEIDALKSSHPISVTLNRTDQITQIFDAISYTKGCSIIHMMYHFLGADVFQSGIRRYLRTYAYQNAEQDDLWEALTLEAHSHRSMMEDVTVKTVMDTWTLQAGYPILHVNRNSNTGTITVYQEQFCWTTGCEDSTQLWWIPLTWTKQGYPQYDKTIPKAWLHHPTLELNDTVNEDEWILFNLGQTGYYRVNYDDKNWKLLSQSMELLPAAIRAQLVDDVLANSRAGILKYKITMDLLQNLENETDYLVWDSAIRGLRYMHNKLHSDASFNKWMQKLVQKIFKFLGTEEKDDDGHRERRYRGDILRWACEVGHEECRRNAHQILQNWTRISSGDNPIPPNLRSWIYCTGLEHAGKNEWNFVWNQYLQTTSGAEKELLLDGLGCISNESILSNYLAKTLSSNSGVRKQDGWRVFRSIAETPNGLGIAFRFLRENWSALNDYYGTGFSAMAKMVQALSKYMSSESDLRQLEKFKDSVNLGVTNTAFQQTIEEVRINVDWVTKYMDQIQNILNQT
ncbi:aminopeptidase N-like isoform X2 [Athalia rosae]|uniref:aminopeptidase N-like isoform X2 n=1 Tax=Athalia rosae TaxID=37344 RepID=UPI0020344631|nr:aminopeptidase N-like isoform X2 [Athalia rosae]